MPALCACGAPAKLPTATSPAECEAPAYAPTGAARPSRGGSPVRTSTPAPSIPASSTAFTASSASACEAYERQTAATAPPSCRVTRKESRRAGESLLARRAALDALAEAPLDLLLGRVGQLLLALAEAPVLLGVRRVLVRYTARVVRFELLLRRVARLVIAALVALVAGLLGARRVLVLGPLDRGLLGRAGGLVMAFHWCLRVSSHVGCTRCG